MFSLKIVLLSLLLVCMVVADYRKIEIASQNGAQDLFTNAQWSEKRLVQLDYNSEPIWLTRSELLKLSVKKIKFADVTEPITTVAPPQPPPLPTQPFQKTIVRKLIPQLNSGNLVEVDNQLANFFTRYYTSSTGVEAAQWIYESATDIIKSLGSKATVNYFNNTFPQPSVIVRFPGRYSNDVVILGSHLDSVGSSATGRSPGADDDGSGASSVMEVLRVLTNAYSSNNIDEWAPNRTVEFHFYAAEEAGLLGSKAIANSYLARGINVVGMMQLDMTGYLGPGVVGLVTDQVNANLTSFVRLLIDSYLDITWKNTICGYACSDHASWTFAGYRSTFPFETPFGQRNPYIHSAQDTISKLDPNHWLEFAKLGLSFLVELSATNYTSA